VLPATEVAGYFHNYDEDKAFQPVGLPR